MAGRVQDRVALVTGAAQGIGKACAEVLAKEGAFVFLTDVQDELGETVAKAIGPRAVYLHQDVSSEAEWEKVIGVILQKKGALNILVNNAGITGLGRDPQDPENESLESWRKIHAVNAEGVFLGCKYGIRAMKKGQGSMINISSRSGVVGIPGAAAYAASKAAVRNHTKSVALYCCQKGYKIRCNSVHPAAILTPMWDPMLGTGSQRQEMMDLLAKDIPMGRLGEAEDVAYAVLFLASDESKYITGTELVIDGGILAGSAASPGKKSG